MQDLQPTVNRWLNESFYFHFHAIKNELKAGLVLYTRELNEVNLKN